MCFGVCGHRLELSIKDALKSTFFDKFDVMPLLIYEKSPKKCRILDGIIDELRVCLEPQKCLAREDVVVPVQDCRASGGLYPSIV